MTLAADHIAALNAAIAQARSGKPGQPTLNDELVKIYVTGEGSNCQVVVEFKKEILASVSHKWWLECRRRSSNGAATAMHCPEGYCFYPQL